MPRYYGDPAKRAEIRTWSGFRSVRHNPRTGTFVVVLDAYLAGLSDPEDPYDLRWATVCDDHDRLVLHDTIRLAESHAADPEGWCGVCAGTEEPEPEEETMSTNEQPDYLADGLVEASVGRWYDSRGRRGVSVTFSDRPAIRVEMTAVEMIELATDLMIEARKAFPKEEDR